MNRELPDVQAGFRKYRGTRDQVANIHWVIEKSRNSSKTSISASLTMLKPLTVYITTNCGKFLKSWEYTEHFTCLLRNPYAGQEAIARTLEPDTEQQTGSKLGKEYVKAVYCQLAYLTYT